MVLDTGRQGLTGIWIQDTQEWFCIQADRGQQVYGYRIYRSSPGYMQTGAIRYMDTEYTGIVLDTGRQGTTGICMIQNIQAQSWIRG